MTGASSDTGTAARSSRCEGVRVCCGSKVFSDAIDDFGLTRPSITTDDEEDLFEGCDDLDVQVSLNMVGA